MCCLVVLLFVCCVFVLLLCGVLMFYVGSICSCVDVIGCDDVGVLL